MTYEYIKKYIYQLSNDIGFANSCDFIKILLSEQNDNVSQENTSKEDSKKNNWLYCNKSFYIPPTAEEQIKHNTPEVDFSIAHEFCHMIQDFIYKSNINLHNFTKERYQYELNKFFNTKDIVVTDEAYNKFKEFIKESPLFNDKMKEVMKFDDLFYISTEAVDSQRDEATGIAPYYLYNENTNEIHANAFASDYVFKQYQKSFEPMDKFQSLKDKILTHYKSFNFYDTIRDKDTFNAQIDLYNLQIKKYDATIYKREKHKITINKLKGLCNYNHYDFQEASHEISKMINQVQTIIDTIDLQYKTEEQQREVDKLKEEVKENIITRISQIDKEEKSNKLSLITFVDNFAPLEQDEGKYRIYTYADKDISHMHIDVANFTNHFTKELVIDMQNNKMYLFYYERTKTNEVANKVLESNDVSISSKQKDVQNTEVRNKENINDEIEEFI